MNKDKDIDKEDIENLGNKIASKAGFTTHGVAGGGTINVQAHDAYVTYKLVNANYIDRLKKKAEKLRARKYAILLFIVSALFSLILQELYSKISKNDYNFGLVFVSLIFFWSFLAYLFTRIDTDRLSSIDEIISTIAEIEKESNSDDNSTSKI
jgi:hypothetical protein